MMDADTKAKVAALRQSLLGPLSAVDRSAPRKAATQPGTAGRDGGDVPRWRDGSPRDRLAWIEDPKGGNFDEERFLLDLAYQSRPEIRKLANERALLLEERRKAKEAHDQMNPREKESQAYFEAHKNEIHAQQQADVLDREIAAKEAQKKAILESVKKEPPPPAAEK